MKVSMRESLQGCVLIECVHVYRVSPGAACLVSLVKVALLAWDGVSGDGVLYVFETGDDRKMRGYNIYIYYIIDIDTLIYYYSSLCTKLR